MGDGAFENTALTSIEIPDGLRVIPEYAFSSCRNLSQITWGDAVEVIGYCAFSDCAVKELHFPATLRTVGEACFYSNNNKTLKRVFFSAPVDTLGPALFERQSLKVLLLKNTVPPVPTLSEYAEYPEYGCLYDTEVDSIVIPCGSLSAYLADEYWGQFADKYYEDCNGIDDAEEDGVSVYSVDGRIVVEGAEGESLQVYDIEGRRVVGDALPTGVYLVKVGDRPARKIVVL